MIKEENLDKMQKIMDQIFDSLGIVEGMTFIRSCWGAMLSTCPDEMKEWKNLEIQNMKDILDEVDK